MICLVMGMSFLMLALINGGNMATDSCLVYFGTYTSSGKSKGIYTCRLDTSTGILSTPELATETVNPSFLAIHPDRRHLYAVGESGVFGGGKTGAVSAFAIDQVTGKLTLLNCQSTGGLGPCHVNVDLTGKCVLAANYTSGSCASLPVRDDGSLGEIGSFIQHEGSSINPSRQTGPHAHSINLSPDNRFAFVADLGLDKLMIYKLDPARAALIPNNPPFAKVPPGSGPRHMAFHPDGRFAYVINEMLCTVTAFSYEAGQGALKKIQTFSTLPKGVSVQPGYSTAEVLVHPRGKFLYGSNRGHDTIAVFAIDQSNGTLRLIQNESTQGKMPRSFGIDPTGAWLLAANQDTGNVVVFSVNPKTGKLKPTGQIVEVGVPVCVKFMSVKED
ncbi:MAG: lactonase family protein [Verrucomicrobia bacterium]|nr:lactonase family protein [Verrucomicrobiota bacterium]MBU1856148.1 lactonase family protein [Verrucomicrobiota bacterium]